jgi:hypothetical protein
MNLTWTKLATDGVDVEMIEAERSTLDLAQVEAAIPRMIWEDAAGQKPMSPALAIKAVIREFELRGVTRIAISHDLAPYGLFGIEVLGGRQRIYVLDRGHDIVPLALETREPEPAEAS